VALTSPVVAAGEEVEVSGANVVVGTGVDVLPDSAAAVVVV
jgi:hypothetical protein